MSSRCLWIVVCIFFASIAKTAWADPPKPTDGPLGVKFVPLPKATYFMGWDGEKKGVKTVIKEDFEIAVHTVTQGQWHALMGNNPSYFSRDGKGKDLVKDIADADLKQFPVENVSWDDAQEFIKKLNEKERGKGWRYRLPTEEEWEYACRGAATSEAECSHHFYNDAFKPTDTLTTQMANFNGTRTTKVGSYRSNKIGLYDMHGNVWQWCEDFYEKGGSHRVFRGGGWSSKFDYACRAGYRVSGIPSRPDNDLGFRLVRVPAGDK